MNHSSRNTTVAMQQLTQLLDQFDLADWREVLVQWLPNFDGWLAVMEAFDDDDNLIDDAPEQQIIELLQQYPAHMVVNDIDFSTGISQLPFLDRRARLTRCGKRWSALEESFAKFVAVEPDEVPHVYETPHGESITKYWLLGKLYEVRSMRLAENHVRPSVKQVSLHP